jgi:hypothetical protein
MCNVRQSLVFIYDCRKKRCAVRLYLQLFVGGRMSYLRYLYLSAHSGVQHILCYVFLHLVYPMLPVYLDCPFLIAPSLSLTFIYIYIIRY